MLNIIWKKLINKILYFVFVMLMIEFMINFFKGWYIIRFGILFSKDCLEFKSLEFVKI